MQKMGKEIFTIVGKEIFTIVLTACIVAVLPTSLFAAVKGPCANCHTMHNSQNSTNQSFTGTDAHWTGATFGGTGSSTTTPNENLLKTDCIGCHSETGTVTAVPLGGDAYVPIVWNLGGYPAQPLAGGNFNRVADPAFGDAYGHNVFGIGTTGADDDLSVAPGFNPGVGCGTSSCHADLSIETIPDGFGAYSNTYFTGGCRGCHLVAGLNGGAHHNPNDNSYRMLSGHLDLFGTSPPVLGVEDNSDGAGAGWEANASDTRHNTYLNRDYSADLNPGITIGRFCVGCHGYFHAMGQDDMMAANINGGDLLAIPLDNPWLRHPNDVEIPVTLYEYAQMDGDPYNPNIPVGQNADDDNINAGDQVICLSCHRAHASQYPDALRWDYTAMNAHSTAADDNVDGCFFCHRTKDDTP